MRDGTAVAGGKKKKKRPLKDGTYGPPSPRPRRDGRALTLSPRTVRRTSALLALLTPLTLIGLATLASNPDYGPFAFITAILVIIAAVLGLMLIRPSGWFLWPGVLLVILLLVLPMQVFTSEVMRYRGVPTEVVITAMHSSKKKNGGLSWTCDIRRADGLPLPHAKLSTSDCWDPDQVGTTTTVLVDRDGWVPPTSTDQDYTGLDYGVAAVGVTAALWALLSLGAGRRTLRLAGS
ncbi:hypothetical protein P3T37_006271 [Kitasatospora sp. MAA4]|uniref:hypothetical protein n=1 Tax=Kitasatospora sp. MAA4 TaxID=3035093 RepID=UPI0024757572|nr:hypothetical protein [Kitasatospora sp. MAA4]MDH6136840.1 hypothetical protein [Kitasatospora sp. MAA4]